MSVRLLLAPLVVSAAIASSASAQTPRKVQLTEAQPGLIAMARVHVNDALKVALSSKPGAVTTERIEKRGGLLVYVFGIRHNGGVHHVIIDANTGAVVAAQAHKGARSRSNGKGD